MPSPDVSPLRCEAQEETFVIYPPGASDSGEFWRLPWNQLENLRRELHLLKQPTGGKKIEEAEIILPPVPGEILSGKDFTIDDWVRLVPRGMSPEKEIEATRYLQRWGYWWKVKGATNKGAAWILTSVADQTRENKKGMFETFVIPKQGNLLFAFVSAWKFPKPFHYKTAETFYKAEVARRT